MSEPAETNNQHRVPTPDASLNTALVRSYNRDPKYYCNDGNIVFLVGGVLFKLHRSIILSHMAEKPGELPRITKSDLEQHGKGMNDYDPFVIGDASPQQFRWFLLLLLGTPANPEYRTLFMGTNDARNHTKDAFVCHLGIVVLARYLGMPELEFWSYSQLELILKSVTRFVNSSWDKGTLLQAMDYASRTRALSGRDLRVFTRLALSITAPNNPIRFQSPPSSNLATCVALYKDPNFPETQPSLFGYVFTVILSLGHRSCVWAHQLSREERNVLYAAQVHLVSPYKEAGLSDLSWLSLPPSQTAGVKCASCTKHLDTAWNVGFAGCRGLGSAIPLEDISKLVILPSCRQIFADYVRSNPKLRAHNCGTAMLSDIDVRMYNIFHEMYYQYKHFVENA